MSAPMRRVATRRYQSAFRRHASTAAETANAAKEKSQAVASKASEGLTRVTSSAGNAAGKVVESVGGLVGGIGGRTGRLLGFVSSLVPPTIYYSRVTLELGKLVAQGQRISFPSSETFSKAYRSAFESIRSGQTTSSVQRLRNMGTPELVGIGLLGAETLGFFSVGEMIGRFKIVGYRGGKHEEH